MFIDVSVTALLIQDAANIRYVLKPIYVSQNNERLMKYLSIKNRRFSEAWGWLISVYASEAITRDCINNLFLLCCL